MEESRCVCGQPLQPVFVPDGHRPEGDCGRGASIGNHPVAVEYRPAGLSTCVNKIDAVCSFVAEATRKKWRIFSSVPKGTWRKVARIRKGDSLIIHL